MTSDNGIADHALVLDDNMTQFPFVHYSVVEAFCRSRLQRPGLMISNGGIVDLVGPAGLPGLPCLSHTVTSILAGCS